MFMRQLPPATTSATPGREYNLTARVSGRPMVRTTARRGCTSASASLRDFADDVVGTGSGPAINQAPAFIGGAVPADDGWLAASRPRNVSGPFTFLGEYARADVDVIGGSGADFDAWSLEAAYWLTGENTGYDKSKGSWSRSMPKHNFGDGDGQGAWRVALRYDTIDLDDGSVTGGEADQWTFGVSWLLSPNTGVHLNWARYSPDDAANALDTVSVIGLRFEIDF